MFEDHTWLICHDVSLHVQKHSFDMVAHGSPHPSPPMAQLRLPLSNWSYEQVEALPRVRRYPVWEGESAAPISF